MSRRAFPYRLASDGVVEAKNWSLLVGDNAMELPDALEDWDYHMDLRLRREVRVDLDQARADTGLTANTRLGLAVIWSATGSNLRVPALRMTLEGKGVQEFELKPDLRGENLGGLLALETMLVLAESPYAAGPATPRRGGSRIWMDRQTVRLQGDAPQFPMTIIDFDLTSYPSNAGWHLKIDGGMTSATMGSIILLINEKHKGVARAFESAKSPRKVDALILSAVYADVTKRLVDHGLTHDEFAEDASFPEESMGATLQSLFARLFPHTSVAELRRRRDQAPSLFTTDVQAAIGIFQERS